MTSSVFDPGLLLRNQALHKLGAFSPPCLDTLVKEHLTNLGESPLLVVRYALQLALQFRSDPKS